MSAHNAELSLGVDLLLTLPNPLASVSPSSGQGSGVAPLVLGAD